MNPMSDFQVARTMHQEYEEKFVNYMIDETLRGRLTRKEKLVRALRSLFANA